jgi:oligo-1,6-glucosidase
VQARIYPWVFQKMDPNWSLVDFKKIYSDWDAVYDKKRLGNNLFRNHDQPRMTLAGNDSPQYRELSSKMLSTFLLSMRGTPYYYNGDEIEWLMLNLIKSTTTEILKH